MAECGTAGVHETKGLGCVKTVPCLIYPMPPGPATRSHVAEQRVRVVGQHATRSGVAGVDGGQQPAVVKTPVRQVLGSCAEDKHTGASHGITLLYVLRLSVFPPHRLPARFTAPRSSEHTSAAPALSHTAIVQPSKVVRCLAYAGPQIAKKLASQAPRINRVIKENETLADPSRQRANEAALVYAAAGGGHSKLSRQQVAENHNISVGALRAAENRLHEPTGLLPTTVAECPKRSPLVTDDILYIVGKHVVEQAANDAALTWAEIQGLFLVAVNVDHEGKGEPTVGSFTNST